ncbi:MAG: phosphate signaling complex protein PhoU [Thermoguttaceae bacterium]
MGAHLQREIDRLKKQVLSLCSLVEGQVEKALRAVIDLDEALAEEVERDDLEIDQREIEVEEECLKTLALHQPVAADLRMIIAALKINNDLERIGDMAVNIARKGRALAGDPPPDLACDLGAMWRKTQAMLRDSIDALVNLDVAAARSVCKRDDEVDAMKLAVRKEVEEVLRRQPERVASLLRILAVSRNLERIADLATNIAEDVIYLVEGHIIRHGMKLRPETEM